MRAAALVLLAACGSTEAPRVQPHSSSIAVSADGATVYVVNADSDSISIIDTASRTLTAEVLLADARPATAPDGTFAPAIMPRALALAPDGATLYVTGQRSGRLYAIELGSRQIRSVATCSEPVGVAASGDRVYVACSQDARVVELDAESLAVTRGVATAEQPWGLAWSRDGSLYASHLMGPGATRIEPHALVVDGARAIPDIDTRGDARLAHGQVRGVYDIAERPGSAELWTTHLLLGTDTAQPELDFETTVFPAVTIFDADGYHATLSNDALDLAGIDGAFGDVVSGPHAIAFTSDGALALVLDTNSEDVLAIDTEGRTEGALLRPLPGHMAEGIAIAPDDSVAYVDLRNSGTVAVVRIDRSGARPHLEIDGAPIARLEVDPMAALRLGQHLFYSANSDELPITRNHWVACASCHVEGRTDAVTWKFEQGPRDTPSNAGGMLGTGFLFRTADRNRVQDYWHTINIEQGGVFDPVVHAPQLDALADYVNKGIPYPIPPTTDPDRVARGLAIFQRADVGCATCHAGPRFTDSGGGNPTLDLAGFVMLHDVGTCVTAMFPDVEHDAVDGRVRAACLFDTPSLRGIAASAPYLHDGSAPTLRDVLERTRGKMGNISSLSADDLDDLVEYLRSL